MLESLKKEVLQANLDLVRFGLVTLTWGNVSGVDRSGSYMVIKPSGVDYESMTVDDMVVVRLDGSAIEGHWRPSSDTPTHLGLYRAFPSIGGIVHTHSTYATMFAQACREIPCLGTTHADHFDGPVPVTRFLTPAQVSAEYERETATVIIECFAEKDPMHTPAVLVAGHAPFVWGESAADAVRNSVALERVAHMALGSFQLRPDLTAMPAHIQAKHYQRKHGPNAYYGQKNK